MTKTPYGSYELIATLTFGQEIDFEDEFTKEEWDAKTKEKQQNYLDRTTKLSRSNNNRIRQGFYLRL